MGYTHYWYRHDHMGASDHTLARAHEAYDLLAEDVKHLCLIVGELPDTIWLADAGGEGYPEFHDDYFAYNGTYVNDQWHESFVWDKNVIVPEWQQGKGFDYKKKGVFFCCKTARKPYDTVVVATLLRASHYYGDTISIASDGTWEEWGNGRDLYESAFGTAPVCPSYFYTTE